VALAVLSALDRYRLGERHACVAATTGILRPARGIDRGLLDLASLEEGTVLVPDVTHGAWDGESLAEAWSASSLARHAFVAVRAPIQRKSEEASLSDPEIALLHDDPERLDWLTARLIEARRLVPDAVGIMLPPWLGIEHERATFLSHAVGLPCGEALGGVGSSAGVRFERARDRALASAGVSTPKGWARVVRPLRTNAWGIVVSSGAETLEIECDAVVLATGGVLGGGLAYTPAGSYVAKALPDTPRPLLQVTCEAPVTLGANGRPLDDPSSLFGGAPERHAWPLSEDPLLDRAGILVGDEGEVQGAPGLFAAGEVAAGPSHTWLAALASGARAGRAAARG
jgi:glycerol-3-phosphate dehydrogenase subunit B